MPSSGSSKVFEKYSQPSFKPESNPVPKPSPNMIYFRSPEKIIRRIPLYKNLEPILKNMTKTTATTARSPLRLRLLCQLQLRLLRRLGRLDGHLRSQISSHDKVPKSPKTMKKKAYHHPKPDIFSQDHGFS